MMDKTTEDPKYLWLTRFLVLLSFAAHLTLALLARIRRRRYSGVRRSLVWLAYNVTDIGTSITLTKVFLDTTYIEQQQMFAFWAPFMVLHLGRPDNITCYTFENKGLSLSQRFVPYYAIGGAIYGSYKQGFMHGDKHLQAAFIIMLLLAFNKCVERVVALRQASFANIHRSNKRKKLRRISIENNVRSKQDNDDVLLDAHGLLGVTMGAFAEYESYRPHDYWEYYSSSQVLKLVEMEASLMYDMLYTKASVIHTWYGYIMLSLLVTTTALCLFHGKESQGMGSADRMVTYILLVGTLVLDMRWLLRALGSTWTYAFLVDTEKDDEEESKDRRHCWNPWANSPWLVRLKQAARRAGRTSWYLFRFMLVSMDLARLSLRSGPSGHRLLPGSGVGQRNLLHECSTPQVKKKKIDVKDELFEVMSEYLKLNLANIFRIAEIPRDLADYMRDNARICSFERNLIALHIATDIFFLYRPQFQGIERETPAKYEKQIRAISDYMMFLLALRQHMVLPPGDKGSQYKKARLDLMNIWRERRPSSSQTTREAELAIILLDMDETPQGSNQKESILSDRNDTLALGADWALKLLHQLDPTTYGYVRDGISAGIRSRVQSVRRIEDFILVFNGDAQEIIKGCRDDGRESELLDYVLRLILVSWVRFLTFTSSQCSRESHAKQLNRGGELLTIVWLMNQHKENALRIDYV